MPTANIQESLTPDQVLERLRAGNARFASGKPRERDARGRIRKTATRQTPLAVVLACSDARVPTELVFDVGVGEIFSIRIAGNVCPGEALGSMEFGCGVTGARLLLVLGHTGCGAIHAGIDVVAQGEDAIPDYEHLRALAKPLVDVVNAETETRDHRDSGNPEFVRRVTELNVRRTLAKIPERSSTLRQLVEEGQLRLIGGVYDVATGQVAFLDDGKDQG